MHSHLPDNGNYKNTNGRGVPAIGVFMKIAPSTARFNVRPTAIQ